MHSRIVLGFSVVAIMILACSLTIAQEDQELKKEEALAAAGSWLALVDQGNYGESWEQGAEYFKNAVSKEEWVKSMQGTRKPLGAVVSRKVQRSQLTKTLPGAPDGLYWVILYSTSFANKKTAVETVTPMIDADGKWRVSGYTIK